MNLILFWYDKFNYKAFRELCVAYPNLGVETVALVGLKFLKKKNGNSSLDY